MNAYLVIKSAHLTFVTCSGLLFIVRGAAVLAHHRWPIKSFWRILSYLIDTGLLATGLMLIGLLAIDPVSSLWLGVKLLLMLVYIVLGSFALKRAKTVAGQRLAYVGAVCLLLFIASIALAHHPLGVLRGWVGQV